jgi:hypothetical protein
MKHKGAANSPKENLDRFEPRGNLGAIENKNEYEARINSLPADERELARESARFADLCRYFERVHADIAPEFIDQLGVAARLPVEQRIRAMKKLNQSLMEYLSNVGNDSGFRQ